MPLSIGFNTSHAKRQPAGGISIFSHSGALFDAMAGRLRMLGAGLSLFASAGNEADLSVLDYMEYAIGHAPTRVIALLIDSLDDGARFRRLALQAARGRQARRGVEDRRLGSGSARRGGAFLAHRRRQRGLRCAVRGQRRRHRRVAGRLHDRRGAAGPLRPPPGRPGRAVHLRRRRVVARRSLRRAGRSAGGACRRTRIGASTATACSPASAIRSTWAFSAACGAPARCRRCWRTIAGVGAALALVHSMNPWQGDPIRAALANARETSGKPLLIVAPGGMPDAERAWYETRGMDVFTETDIVLEAIGAMLTPPPAAAAPVMVREAHHPRLAMPVPRTSWMAGLARHAQCAELPHRTLTEPESLRLLAQRSACRSVPTVECATVDAVLAAAERIGWPVVLKGVAEGVAHKSELGLVRTNLRDAAALRAAYATLGTRTARSCSRWCRRRWRRSPASAARPAWDWYCCAASAASTPKRCATSASGPSR